MIVKNTHVVNFTPTQLSKYIVRRKVAYSEQDSDCLDVTLILLEIRIDGLVQERRNSISNALEVALSRTNTSICRCHYVTRLPWLLCRIRPGCTSGYGDAKRQLTIRNRCVGRISGKGYVFVFVFLFFDISVCMYMSVYNYTENDWTVCMNLVMSEIPIKDMFLSLRYWCCRNISVQKKLWTVFVKFYDM